MTITTITGTSGNDSLTAAAGDNLIQGLDGNDMLTGGTGQDTLNGGAGNDVFGRTTSSTAVMTMVFDEGFGSDRVTWLPFTSVSAIQLASSYTSTNARLSLINNGSGDAGGVSRWVLSFAGSSDSIEFLAAPVVYIAGDDRPDKVTATIPTTITFGDGVVWTSQDFLNHALTADQPGLVVYGSAAAEVLGPRALAPHVVLAGAGDDTLVAGAFSDILSGGAGNDSYVFNAGWGLTSGPGVSGSLVALANGSTYTHYALDSRTSSPIEIVNGDTTAAAQRLDVIRFGEGIASDSVLFNQSGSDLTIQGRAGEAGAIVVRGYFDQATGGFINAIVFADGTQLGLADIVTRINTVVSVGTPGADTLSGRAFDDLLQGLGGDDLLSGSVGNDTLLGGEGNDTLNGDVGNDVLTDTSGNNLLQGGWGDDHYTGGSGNDVFRDVGGLQTVGTGKAVQTVWSEGGSDTYTLQAGFGHDTIYEADYVTSPNFMQVPPYGAEGSDVIEFGAGILASDLMVERGVGSSTAVRIRSRVSTDTLDIVTGDIEALKFADGTQWAWSDVLNKLPQPQTITGTTGKDSLLGGGGDDTISGLAGNDTLNGGLGNDRLIGGKGNDTYLFQRGGGQDVILDQDNTWFNSDLLKVGDASSRQLWLTRSGNNLDISVIGTTDKVTIEEWYASSNNRIEKITALGDNKSLSYSKVNALVTAMAAFAPPAPGQTTLPADVQASLSKVLASSWV